MNERPIGSTIDVYYNPDDPGSALLMPGEVDAMMCLFVYVCGFFAVFSFFWLIHGALTLRKLKRESTSGAGSHPD